MSAYWAKLQCSILDDPAVATLPDSAWRRLHECLLLAKTAEFEGDARGFLPPVAISAWRLHIPPDVLAADLTRLAAAGFCELRVHPPTGDERWYLTGYEATQRPASDAERMRALRQRKAAAVTNRNDFVTLCVPEQEAEQEAEQKTDREPAAAAPAAVVSMDAPAAAAASDMQLLLRRHGIGWNRQTRQLQTCSWVDDDYVAAHVAAAEARGEGRGLVIRRMLGHESPPAVKGAPAAATATAWDSWQAWLARHGDNGDAAVAELDAPTRRMLGEFGRDDLAMWDAAMFAAQYELARQNGRRRIPHELENVIQR